MYIQSGNTGGLLAPVMLPVLLELAVVLVLFVLVVALVLLAEVFVDCKSTLDAQARSSALLRRRRPLVVLLSELKPTSCSTEVSLTEATM